MFDKIIKGILIVGFFAINFYLFYSYKYKNEKWLNDAICKFAKHEVKSKVIKEAGHGRYQWLMVNDSTRYYYQVSKVIVSSFKYNSIDVGDSIVKEANSNKITVYRGDKKAIYILRCED